MPGFPVLHHLPMLAQSHVHQVSDAIQPSRPCCPLLLLTSIFPSIRISSNELDLRISWPYYWSFSFSPSSEYSGLISFRMDWFDFIAVQGTLQESSQTLQFKGINSLVLSFLYGRTLRSMHDHWENHSLDWTDLCWQSDEWMLIRSWDKLYTGYGKEGNARVNS